QLLDLLVAGRELGVKMRERRRVERIFDDEEAIAVERTPLLGGDCRERSGVVLPGETGVPRMRSTLHDQWWKLCLRARGLPALWVSSSFRMLRRSWSSRSTRSWVPPLRITMRMAGMSVRLSGNVYAGTSQPCSRRRSDTSNTV